jgi:hypothetical protein
MGLGASGGVIYVGCCGYVRCLGATGGLYAGEADRGMTGGNGLLLPRALGLAAEDGAAGWRAVAGRMDTGLSCDCSSFKRVG